MSDRLNAGPNRRRLERRLVAEVQEAFEGMGMSKAQGRRLGRQMLDAAKQEAKRMGRAAELYREGDGDRILEAATSDPEAQRLLERLKRQGVTDEDFRQWHNLSLLEKLCLREQDNAALSGLDLQQQDQGPSSGAAADDARAQFPLYTWDIDEIDEGDPHARLPIELKSRVNAYQLRRIITDPEKLRSEIGVAGSFNAHVRELIARDAL